MYAPDVTFDVCDFSDTSVLFEIVVFLVACNFIFDKLPSVNENRG